MKLSAVVLMLGAGIASAQTANTPQNSIETHTTVIGTPSQKTLDMDATLRQQAEAKLQAMMQQMAQQQAARDACPVELTSATFAPYTMLVRSNGADAPGGLDLGLRNRSGKPIASLSLSVQLLVKKSVYDMQAYPLSLPLTARGGADADRELDQLSHIALPTGLHPATIRNVTLASVTYSDGSTWTPTLSMTGAQVCSLHPNPMQEVAAK